MFGFALLLAIAGATLIYSGYKGIDPRSIIASVFTGQEPNRLAEIPAGGTSGGVSSAGNPATTSGCNDNVQLVRINGVQLSPDAAAGIRAAERLAGVKIQIGGGWRSCESQERCYQNKPGVCVSPDSSWHPRGKAVDLSPISYNNSRIRQAMLRVGWCFPNPREPWHASFGGCG